MATMRRRGLAAFAVVCALAGASVAARADSWGPYQGSVRPDAMGRRYVVLHAAPSGWGAEFVLAEAAPGSPDVVLLVQKERYGKPGSEIDVRPNDHVVLTGTLRSAPLEVRVSSAGHGLAAMKEYMQVGYGDSFVWVGADGKTKHVRGMHDLFTQAEIEGFRHTVSSIWWFHAAWIDDEAKEVVVVGAGGLVRVVSMATGGVRSGGDAELLRGAGLSDPEAQIPAIDLLAASKADGVDPALVTAFSAPTSSPTAKLHAAGSLARRGDSRGKALLVALAATPRPAGTSKEDRAYALAHVAIAAGMDAVPLLKDAMRGPSASEGWSAAMDGFVSLGEKATGALVAMLTEPQQSNDYRGGAAHALGRIKDRKALPGLLAAVADPQEYVANAALNAAIATGGASISKELAVFLDQKTTQDGRFSSYFRETKEPASVGPMVRALRRWPTAGYPRDILLAALAFQTDVTLGNGSTEGWEAWFRTQKRFK